MYYEKEIFMYEMKLGIIGSGQLARMLAQSAFSLGTLPFCLANSHDDPAAQLCPSSIIGNFKNIPSLERFFEQSDLIAFENEFVDCDLLEKINSNYKKKFLPSLNVIRLVQDKLEQKRVLEDLSIPFANYKLISPQKVLQNIKSEISSLLQNFKNGIVLKWAKLGYDGKGTFIIDSPKVDYEKLKAFLEKAIEKNVKVFAEEKINFVREVAMIGCYSINEEFQFYPLVISQQNNGICHRVYGPAISFGVAEEIEKSAANFTKKIATELKLYGSFALEFFEDENGKLFVNELAPRVHNTGHYTLDADCTSQFENHWRALLGMSIGQTKTHNQIFFMQNLIGERINLHKLSSEMHMHWYSKDKILPGRKVGHINATSEDKSNSKLNFQWVDKLSKEINSIVEKENEN